MPRRRAAFVINSLGAGGAERVMIEILRHTPRDEWDIDLVILDKEDEKREPPGFVGVHQLDCRLGLGASVRGLHGVLKRLRPDLIVSFLVRANIAAVLSGRLLGIKCVISERAQLSAHLAGKYGGSAKWAAGLPPRLTYPFADHVIAVSRGVQSDLVGRFGLAPHKVSAIPNPCDIGRIVAEGAAPPEFPLPERFMVSAGRLTASKGFADLVSAYALARPELPLIILGEGPDRRKLQEQINALGLGRRIFLPGYARNPFAIVSRAEFFISASHVEGFPNVLAEAMALGVPVASTDCPSGPAELLDEVETTGCRDLHEGRYGLLAPVRNPPELAKAMWRLSLPGVHAHYARKASQRIQDYRTDRVAGDYWATLDAVAAWPAQRATALPT